MLETAYIADEHEPEELEHRYGDRVHVLPGPYLLTLLARLCSPGTVQPAINDLIEQCYRGLLERVFSRELPRVVATTDTRMVESTDRGRFHGSIIDPTTRVVTVNIARAGTFPSHTCYQMLNQLLNPAGVRQDHLVMNRATDASGKVIGAEINGSKVGGSMEGRVLIIPDPMGATASSMIEALRHFRDHVAGTPTKIIHAHLIVTPEYVRALHGVFPEVIVYAIRLDRGTSPEEVLSTVPGSDPRETGLDGKQYIVPGGGGFGEILNNAEI